MIFSRKKCVLFIISLILLFALYIRNNLIVIKYADFFTSVFRNDSNLIKIDKNFQFDNLIAHGGGGINGMPYTNSLEALEKNYNNGFHFFEIDLSLTKDNNIILCHCFSKSSELEEFKSLLKNQNLIGMTLEDLNEWMTEKDDAYIITHILNYDDNINILNKISMDFKNVKDRIIPQVYDFKQYFEARKLNFNKVILTLYLKKYSNRVIVKFINKYSVSAITMPIDRVDEKFRRS